MRLHEDMITFKDAISITAEYVRLPEIYVEKDYWVTLALYRIFTSPLSEVAVFKGGTALAKCFTFINRFSEDIDIVVLNDPSLSANQLKNRLKDISSTLGEVLPEIEMPGITNKKGMIRKTAHVYDRLFDGEFGQVRDRIILESSWLGSSEPLLKGMVSTFMYKMMQEKGQWALAAQYDLLPFEVSVLAPARTFCEKIMSLVRFSYTENPINNLRNKVRHIYDLHQLLQQEEIITFFQSSEFDRMMHKVGKDDEVSFRNNKEWLYPHPVEALIFADWERIWPEVRTAYTGSFRRLTYGEFPPPELLFNSLAQIADRLKTVQWSI